MTDKTKSPLANKLKNSTSRLGLRALEPRILLDAAGFVTGADVAVDMLDTQSVAEDMATLFQNNTALAPRDEVSPVDTLLTALKSADLGSADSKSVTDTAVLSSTALGVAPTIDLDEQITPPIPGQDGFTALTFNSDPIITNDGQVGETARYSNVGTINGQSIDLVGTVVRFISDTNCLLYTSPSPRD